MRIIFLITFIILLFSPAVFAAQLKAIERPHEGEAVYQQYIKDIKDYLYENIDQTKIIYPEWNDYTGNFLYTINRDGTIKDYSKIGPNPYEEEPLTELDKVMLKPILDRGFLPFYDGMDDKTVKIVIHYGTSMDKMWAVSVQYSHESHSVFHRRMRNKVVPYVPFIRLYIY